MLRVVSLVVLCALPALPAQPNPPPKSPVTSTTRELFAFPENGTVEILDSVGTVYVEGWNRPDIEVTVVKKTRRAYAAAEQARAQEELERIEVVPVREDRDRFVIRTKSLARNRLKPTRGKGPVEVVYRVKVPESSRLMIHHEQGYVRVAGVRGDIAATNGEGALSLRLPNDESWRVDALSRVGDVYSEFDYAGESRFPADHQASEAPAGPQLHLRMGVGSIDIKKQWKDPEVPKAAAGKV